MSRPELDMIRDVHNGIELWFTTGEGIGAVTYFPSPPANIDHVDLEYLQGRFRNLTTKKEVMFIKKEYKRLYEGLFGEQTVDEIKYVQVPFQVMLHCDGKIKCECWVLSNSRIDYGVDLEQPMMLNEFLHKVGEHLTSMNCKSLFEEAKWFVIDDGTQIKHVQQFLRERDSK